MSPAAPHARARLAAVIIGCLASTMASSACSPPLTDLDGDGRVNFADLGHFRALFGSSSPRADFNCSGSVNFADLAIFAGSFGAALRQTGIRPWQLGVIVNTDDPASEEIADYYIRQRSIPAGNLVRLALGTQFHVPRTTFETAVVAAAMPAHVEGLALAFTWPSVVSDSRGKWEGYNSITSAFARGYYTRAAGASGLDSGYANPYYAARDSEPFTRHGIRPAMMLASRQGLSGARALVDRGVSADRTRLDGGEALLMLTSDRIRSLRANAAPALQVINGVELRVISANAIAGRSVAVYLQGLARVAAISDGSFSADGNRFLPGAWADTLTSCSGMVNSCSDPKQTTVWEFLAAGATGSHGTVEEPYAIAGKFVDPEEFVRAYAAGDTLLEAAWKSVRYPYQGLFVGDPLANPWMHSRENIQ